MKRCALVLAAVAALVCQAGFIYASCPATYWVFEDDTWNEYEYPNQIFCDDFDSYCEGGGPPGTPNCAGDATRSNALLQSVWYQSSFGTTITVEGDKQSIIYDVYSGRYASKIELGQQTVRDWVASPPVGQPDQILDFTRKIGEIYGSEYAAVIGSDASPLSLTFAIGTPIGKLWHSSGYLELAFGPQTDPMNSANTDYSMWPKAPCCNGMVNGGPWPMLCAQGNPMGGGIPVEAGCPDVGTVPPPIRNAIAVGSLPLMDTDPCHCGPYSHTPQAYNLAFFDGQVWWTLNSSVAQFFPGATLTGTGPTPMGSAPATPPANYPEGAQAGNFFLSSPTVDTSIPKPAGKANYPVYRSFNTVNLTFKRETVTIELISRIPCSEVDPNNPAAGLYYEYIVTSKLSDVPLKYAGPFDRLRGGVGPGCALASDTEWSTCTSYEGRMHLDTPDGYYVDFDKVVFYGGMGYSIAGACCDATDGACTMELEADCITHGRWTKSSQTCAETICCPAIYGDDNHDGSVDMIDFGALQSCITTGGGGVSAACQCFDFNGSNSIDANDIQHFADCAMGPGIPGNSTGDCEGRVP